MTECPQCQQTIPEEAHFCPSCGASLQQPTDDESTSFAGRVLNQKYRLIDELAEGGMAVVYKAQHMFLDDLCAVKIIKRSLASKDEMLKRFQREARLTRQVARRSPYVIAIYDFGVEDKVGFFYVMELLNGRPFTELIQDPEHIPPPVEAVRFVCQMCEALAVVHEEGLVHRDIKPDNIYLHTEPGQDKEMVKLLDFGIARPTYAKATMLTSYGRVMGTPEYMSPEQCRGPTPQQYERGESHLDGRSDIYSLGVLLYQCLTGEVPFPMPLDGGPMAIHKVMAGHVMEEPSSPVEKHPELNIPPALADAALKALAKEADDRFQTMIEFRDALIQCFPILRSEFVNSQGEEAVPQIAMETVPVIGVDFSASEPSEVEATAPGVDDYYNPTPASPFADSLQPSVELLEQIQSDPQYDISLDRTALDVQLPPEFLEQAAAHMQAQMAKASAQPQTSPEHMGVSPEPQLFAESTPHSPWAANDGFVGVVEDTNYEHELDSDGVDMSKTVTTPFAPEVIEDLRRRAAESIYSKSEESINHAQMSAPTDSSERSYHIPEPYFSSADTVPRSPKNNSKTFWIGVTTITIALLAGIGLLVYFFSRHS